MSVFVRIGYLFTNTNSNTFINECCWKNWFTPTIQHHSRRSVDVEQHWQSFLRFSGTDFHWHSTSALSAINLQLPCVAIEFHVFHLDASTWLQSDGLSKRFSQQLHLGVKPWIQLTRAVHRWWKPCSVCLACCDEWALVSWTDDESISASDIDTCHEAGGRYVGHGVRNHHRGTGNSWNTSTVSYTHKSALEHCEYH